MSFRLVPKSVTLNDLNGIMGLTLRYFTEFGKFRFTDAWLPVAMKSVDLWRNIRYLFLNITIQFMTKFTDRFIKNKSHHVACNLIPLSAFDHISCLTSKGGINYEARNAPAYKFNTSATSFGFSDPDFL